MGGGRREEKGRERREEEGERGGESRSNTQPTERAEADAGTHGPGPWWGCSFAQRSRCPRAHSPRPSESNSSARHCRKEQGSEELFRASATASESFADCSRSFLLLPTLETYVNSGAKGFVARSSMTVPSACAKYWPLVFREAPMYEACACTSPFVRTTARDNSRKALLTGVAVGRLSVCRCLQGPPARMGSAACPSCDFFGGAPYGMWAIPLRKYWGRWCLT